MRQRLCQAARPRNLVADEPVEAIGGIGETITEVNEIAATIAAAVEEQGTATQDIARNVQEAARG